MVEILVFVAAFLTIIAILGAVWLNADSKRIKMTRNIVSAFEAHGLEVTKQIRTLYIDERNKKWAVAKIKENPVVHDYSEIDTFEINENGVSYGGSSIGLADEHWGVNTTVMSKYVNGISVLIRLSSMDCPIEAITLIASSVNTNSQVYKKAFFDAQQIIAMLSIMKKETIN